jgi:hypothetical protein
MVAGAAMVALLLSVMSVSTLTTMLLLKLVAHAGRHS